MTLPITSEMSSYSSGASPAGAIPPASPAGAVPSAIPAGAVPSASPAGAIPSRVIRCLISEVHSDYSLLNSVLIGGRCQVNGKWLEFDPESEANQTDLKEAEKQGNAVAVEILLRHMAFR